MPGASMPRAQAPTIGADIDVGVGRADVTPPPGVATFGHGPDARASAGVWTRLYCRAYVFAQAEGAFAIVPCDLAAISTLLQRRVVVELARRSIDLPASRLMLTATHTHAGPAHYFDGRAYSGFGSTELPGFDPDMVDFLAKRIAAAVSDAWHHMHKARLRWGRDDVFGLTRNRSMNAFVRNHGVLWPTCPGGLSADECAIDPSMSVLQIAEATAPYCNLGTLSFFAMHPTVLPNTNRLLGADVFGVASRALEADLRASNSLAKGCPQDPLAGIVNTNEGDIVPNWSAGSTSEAIEIGQRLASAAENVSRRGPWLERAEIGIRYVEVDMRHATFGLEGYATCDEAELGAPSSLGASDHPTFLSPLVRGSFAATDPTRSDCQAPKRAFPALVRGQASGSKAFTSVVPIAVARIADQFLTFLPAELTATSGHRVNEAVLAQYPDHDHLHAVVAGLANGYIQYVTTPEEYFEQSYEGASTLFGSRTQALLANLAGALAGRMRDGSTAVPGRLDQARSFQYWLGPERARLPHGDGEASLADLKGQRGQRTTCSLLLKPPAVCFAWTDGAPGIVQTSAAPWTAIVATSPPSPLPELPYAQAPISLKYTRNVVLDDRGIAFRTQVHYPVGDAWLWTSVFQPLADDWSELAAWGPLQIRADVQAEPKDQIGSRTFRPGDMPPPCSVELQRLCGL